MRKNFMDELKDCRARGMPGAVIEILVQNKHADGLFEDETVREWLCAAAGEIVTLRNPNYVSYFIEHTNDLLQKPWTMLGEEIVTAALGLLIAQGEDEYITNMIPAVRETWKYNPVFIDLAEPMVAAALGTKIEHEITRAKKMAEQGAFSLCDASQEMVMCLLPFPEILTQARGAVATYFEHVLSTLPTLEEVAATSDEEIKEMVGIADALANLFGGKAKKSGADIVGDARKDLSEAILTPIFLQVVQKDAKLHASLKSHSLAYPEQFPHACRYFGGAPAKALSLDI